jgi:hypothetical protein
MDNQQFPQHMFLMLPFFFTFFAIATIVMVIPYWQIFKKAGFSPWLALLMFVPLANIIILYVVAFSEWRVIPVPTIYPAGYAPSYPTPNVQTYPPPPPPPTQGTTPPV